MRQQICILLIISLSGFKCFGVTINLTTPLNGFGDSNGSDLAVGSLVEIGVWDETSSTFSLIESGSISEPSAVGILTSNLNTTASGLNIAGDQLAVRWFNSSSQDFGDYGIAYMDINSGGFNSDEWQVKSGNGGGDDSATNSIAISDLNGGDSNISSLVSGASIIRGSFGGSSASFDGKKLYMTAIPEPSSYATIAGLLGLAYAVSRRRRRSSSLTRS